MTPLSIKRAECLQREQITADQQRREGHDDNAPPQKLVFVIPAQTQTMKHTDEEVNGRKVALPVALQKFAGSTLG